MKIYNVNSIPNKQLIITGKGDSNLWNKAIILTDFSSPWKDIKGSKTEFKALWDQDYLFFCFQVFDSNIHIDNTDDSFNSINDSDRVELFFRINESLTPYYCLEIDPSPRIMDFKALPNKIFDFDWNWSKKDLKVKSQITDKSFVVEISISISSLEKMNLINGNKIEAGIFRAKYSKNSNSNFEPTWISWVNPNTKEPNFHTPTSFGQLHLIK